MDDLIQAIAIIIIFGASIISSLMSTWRERQKKLEEQNESQTPPMPKPVQTVKPRPMQAKRPNQQENPSPVAMPEWNSKSLQPQRPGRESSFPSQMEQESPKEDMMRKVFKEIFDIDLPQPELERPTRPVSDMEMIDRPKPKPKPSPPKSAYKLQPVAVEGGAIAAHDRVKTETASKPVSVHPVLARLMREGQTNPLRSAFIVAEILRPPVAMRNMNLPHLHR